MNKTQTQFLQIIKAFVKQEKIALPPDAQLLEIYKLAKIHSLSAVVGYVLNDQLNCQEFTDFQASKQMRWVLFQTVILQSQRFVAFDSLLNHLNEEGISVILMKGCVVNRYYADPAVRTFGDIDILIKESERERLDILMQRLGYTRSITEQTVWLYCKGKERYEVHTDLMPNINVLPDPIQTFVKAAWEHTVPTTKKYIYELDPNYHFLFLLLHIAKHMRATGAGVRMYLDLALMMQNEPALDLKEIQITANKLGFSEFLNTIFYLCSKWFHSEISLAVDPLAEDIFAMLEDYVISAGTFGFYKRNPALTRLRNQKGGINQKSAVLQYIFPSYKSMKSPYPFLKGRPVLLPAVWVMRWWDGLFRRRRRAAAIFKGMFTEADAAKQSERLLQAIGLKTRMK